MYEIIDNNTLIVQVPKDFGYVKQVAIHGGKPWEIDLGDKNGYAIIESIEHIRKNDPNQKKLYTKIQKPTQTAS